MNCLQNLPSAPALPLQSFKSHQRNPYSLVNALGVMSSAGLQLRRSMALKAISGPTSSAEASGANLKEEKSEIYSNNMTEAMGAVLTYRHELGMNYNFISPDLIVGSCLQTPEDVDKLRSIGVKTIFCLQQDPDLEYFGVDINAIRDYAKTYDDITHLRAEIRDFDAFDLRKRLPAVVSKLDKAINRNGGVTYIHCTAGIGRAPAVALAYMFWVQDYRLGEAHQLLLSKRSCSPNLDAIKSTTADIVGFSLDTVFCSAGQMNANLKLTGLRKKLVTLTWEDLNYSTVEVSGLDIGWGQRIPLKFDEEQGLWILRRELPVLDDNPDSLSAVLRKRLTGDDPGLTKDERLKVRQFLEAFPDDEQ
ncbi:hypothetical protein F2P56_016876 [Juglans regia]|uniref:Phosphoglucan phosphatase DSP4, amyloplastic-like n=1 Tax=Juglans regia TaxID=51240 RepID=A0A834CVK1_JUGRE|nr:hypothetical protein F2P56_016876 [Juglans regia]